MSTKLGTQMTCSGQKFLHVGTLFSTRFGNVPLCPKAQFEGLSQVFWGFWLHSDSPTVLKARNLKSVGKKPYGTLTFSVIIIVAAVVVVVVVVVLVVVVGGVIGEGVDRVNRLALEPLWHGLVAMLHIGCCWHSGGHCLFYDSNTLGQGLKV